jgi:hypothetical protein
MDLPSLERIYLGTQDGLPFKQYGFQRPMYTTVYEIVDLIKIAIFEATGMTTDSVRALESGVVEEHAVVAKNHGRKTLLFRLWPVFYSHDKRIEYTIYSENPKIQNLISYYLSIFAKVNEARLVQKK